ncbi:hypothetical protein SeLEV6574_g00534 [Synchytrium endobioticum]|uniref:peptidyl-tRNA hydrolase n=1 Tax=Synchytrium endobioticum TaxID=286115 RepID=A0A507DIA1_9FUNG|nr:hypothetical protein SeLEV6574_g00534 [Synchytrium endobioticum]
MSSEQLLILVACLLLGMLVGRFSKTSKLPMIRGEEDNLDDDTALQGYDAYKLVLVVRKDLSMTKGKVAAQCGHATLAAYKASLMDNPMYLRKWESNGQAKVCLRANDENELLQLHSTALAKGLVARLIRDAGKTQIASGTKTVLAIGPGPISKVDAVTGHLKLY